MEAAPYARDIGGFLRPAHAGFVFLSATLTQSNYLQADTLSKHAGLFRAGEGSVFRVSGVVLSLAPGNEMCYGCLLFSITRKPKIL